MLFAHIFFILFIILISWGVYEAFFKDLAKRQYEMGFMPGPKNFRAYTWALRELLIALLLLLITFYILFIAGILKVTSSL
jgi:hypothetical protein